MGIHDDGPEPGPVAHGDRLVVPGQRLVQHLTEQGGLAAERGEYRRPGHAGTRRPYWFDRPLRPVKSAYQMPPE